MLGLGISSIVASTQEAGALIGGRSSFTNTNSLFTDGDDDFYNFGMASDLVNHDSGSVSCWVNIDASNTSTTVLWSIWDNNYFTTNGNVTGASLIELFYFNTSGSNVFAISGRYRDETSNGTFANIAVDAKTATSHHGKPNTRVSSDYGDFGSSDTTYNAHLLKGSWHHIVYSWDKDLDYTHSSTTHSGSLKIYIDGVLRNHGASTIPGNNATGSATGIVGSDSGTVFDSINIGARFNQNNDMDMLLDEWALFNTALSDSEVATIYNSGVPADLSGFSNLALWLRFGTDGDSTGVKATVPGVTGGTMTNGARQSTTVPTS